ncbi:MAG TPA: stage 0 sporulation protein, partial [Dehalococcoidia bacterium]|nr:stage 0 sporulation protein [Dehalococcoidia bacterium]
MTDVVGVRFKRAGKVYYFDPAGIDLTVGDYVVVETTRGQEMGRVVISPQQVLAS